MTVFQLLGVSLAAVSAAVVVRSYRPELGVQVAVAAGVLLLVLVLDELAAALGFLTAAGERYGVNAGYLKTMLKVLGIAYLAQFAADLCRDAGESAVAGKVELAGRVLILSLCLPALAAVLELVSNLLRSHAAA